MPRAKGVVGTSGRVVVIPSCQEVAEERAEREKEHEEEEGKRRRRRRRRGRKERQADAVG